jgi:hypothetical protein
MTRVLKPFDLQALSIFLCIKVALVTDKNPLILCDRCGHEVKQPEPDTKETLYSVYRSHGYSLIRDKMWLCEECMKKLDSFFNEKPA